MTFYYRDHPEFKDFANHIKQSQNDLRLENMHNSVKELLDIMQTDMHKFQSIICMNAASKNLLIDYHDFPIFSYMSEKEFIDKINILPNENSRYIFYCLQQRYLYKGNELVDELDFLKKVQNLLIEQVFHSKGKLSGYLLSQLNESYLGGIISNLEQIKNSQNKDIT